MASKKKTIYDWLSTRVAVNIRNEENYALKRNLRFSYAQALVVGSAFFVLFSAFSLWMGTKVVGFWYNPREDYFNTKKKVISLAMSLDSLKEQIREKDIFIKNIKSIIETGETSKELEAETQVKNSDSNVIQSQIVDLDYLPEVDSLLRNEFESDQSMGAQKLTNNVDLYEPVLFPPIEGIVTENYDVRKSHYGIDIVAKSDEPVKSISDGVVVFSSWTYDTGYVIGIQHSNNLVSFYKHNSNLLKSTGDKVLAGDIIATIGNTGELTTGPHLHFELWFKGKPINPKELIIF